VATRHIDPAFGTSGIVSRTIPAGIFSAALRVTNDGVLRFLKGSGVAMFERLRADGTTDPGFDTRAFLAFNVAADSAPVDAIVLHDGAIALAYRGVPAGTMIIGRLRRDGAIDGAFGTGGIARVTSDVGDSGLGAWPVRLAEGPDGSIYVVGTMTVTSQDLPADVFFARITASGAVDLTFGVGGVNVLTLPYYNVPFGAVTLADSRLLLGIYSEDEAIGPPSVAFSELWRVSPDGQADPPDSGVALPGIGSGAAMIPVPSDRVLIGDTSGHIERRTADGTLDPSFADGGEVPYSTYIDDAGTLLEVALPIAASADGAFASIATRLDTVHGVGVRVLVVYDTSGKPCGPMLDLPFTNVNADGDSFIVAVAADGSIYVENDHASDRATELTRFVP
jgi:hypothetical protein